MEKESLVKNASSEKQVSKAKKAEKERRRLEIADTEFVMGTEQGRRFVWKVLEECGPFRSIWHPIAAIHYNSGKQDLGHYIMGEIATAGEEYLFKMMSENYSKKEGGE